MARFTQYIGLSPDACEFISSKNADRISTYPMTEGIGYEEVTGDIYVVADPETASKTTYVEVVDQEPWSSGPIIHTCLMHIPSGEMCYRWKDDEIHWN